MDLTPNPALVPLSNVSPGNYFRVLRGRKVNAPAKAQKLPRSNVTPLGLLKVELQKKTPEKVVRDAGGKKLSHSFSRSFLLLLKTM